ncbi:inactive protein RESTRICTED TEV MOVEMENT 2-like [Prosopis cineraria]|uniref:inactive protein RESTRICTED TEV MOVEMENT 2-like n=1 Tax=Prosopis cineraria TaxID=364024 RepID=UPI00240F23EF|nr:inactive protein RESTRICTED TEV MOVEMENT 2-like [Prosopis cineraria]
MASTNLQQTYEDFKPLVEEKDSPDALLLLVHLPGFIREQVGATFEADSRKIRVFGEKPLANNKRQRFKEEYVIPETCDSDNLKGKFEGAVITITMPKKPSSSVIIEEPKPVQEPAKQVTPPTSTSGVESDKDVSQEQPKSELESRRESDQKKDERPTPPEATGESKMPQKYAEEIPAKGTLDDERDKKHRDEIKKTEETPQKAKGESRMPQKYTEEIPPKGTLDDEKNEENQRAEKERIQKEDNKKTSDAGKAPQKVQTLAKEASKEKGKESAMVASKSSGLKTPEKREKETDVKTHKVNKRNYGTKESESPIGKGFKNIANSASQAITRLADGFNEEDKQKLLYAGAAILMVAVGIYASFKLRST